MDVLHHLRIFKVFYVTQVIIASTVGPFRDYIGMIRKVGINLLCSSLSRLVKYPLFREIKKLKHDPPFFTRGL